MVPDHAQDREPYRLGPLQSAGDFRKLNQGVDLLIDPSMEQQIYTVGYAVSDRLIDEALRLRFQVFNEELGEGLMTSRETGLDRDQYDHQMSHLVLLENATQRVIGTYRIQFVPEALAAAGVYSAQEYDLTPLEPLFPHLVETGRACVAKDHRNFAVIMHLWKGIAPFLKMHEARYIFGCCSLTTLDPDDGWRAMRSLRARNAFHDTLMARATTAFSCGDPARETDPELAGSVKIPKLFSAYLAMGAKVMSEPAIDREFGTVDFLVMLDSLVVSYSDLNRLAPHR